MNKNGYKNVGLIYKRTFEREYRNYMTNHKLEILSLRAAKFQEQKAQKVVIKLFLME